MATKANDIQRDITKNRENISDQKLVQQSWFPSRKALKNYTKSFGIKIINKNDPLIQLNSTIDSIASLLKKQLNEMKRIKHIEALKLKFKKTTIDADKNEPKMIFKTAHFNSKAKTIIDENEINESIQTSNQEILKWHHSLATKGFWMDCVINQ